MVNYVYIREFVQLTNLSALELPTMNEDFHIVPWFNSEEWRLVYDDLTNPTSNKKTSLNNLLVWKARCPSLPSGIESTLNLLQVHVEDASRSVDASNDQFMRLAYSSAVMRFVNHMLDTHTAKGASLYQAAKHSGVPEWVIDLRHDTAHSHNLPPLTLLREACKISLQWLQNNYWEVHKPLIQDYVAGQKHMNSIEENKIAVLINFCISLSIYGHPNCTIKKISQIPDSNIQESIINDAKELFDDDMDLSNLEDVSVQSLINIMNKKASNILNVKDVNSFVNDILLGSDSVFLSKDLLYHFTGNDFKKKRLNSSYVQCFEVLITFLHTNDLLLSFVKTLMQVAQNEESGYFRAKLAALWTSEILVAFKRSNLFIQRMNKTSSRLEKPKKRKDLKRLFHHWFPSGSEDILILDLLKPAPAELTDINYIQPFIQLYNPYLSYYIQNLLDLIQPTLPTEVAERICMLAKLISTPEEFPMSSSSVIYTAEDLGSSNGNDDVEMIEPVISETVDIEDKHDEPVEIINNIWKLASKDHDWSSCPIGQVSWLIKGNENN